MQHIRKGDMVQVITGDTRDYGKIGKILEVYSKKERILVQGVNFVKCHNKPSSSNQSGGIVEKEAPIHVSNVMHYCEDEKKPSKVKLNRTDDGKRVRVYAINGVTLKED